MNSGSPKGAPRWPRWGERLTGRGGGSGQRRGQGASAGNNSPPDDIFRSSPLSGRNPLNASGRNSPTSVAATPEPRSTRSTGLNTSLASLITDTLDLGQNPTRRRSREAEDEGSNPNQPKRRRSPQAPVEAVVDLHEAYRADRARRAEQQALRLQSLFVEGSAFANYSTGLPLSWTDRQHRDFQHYGRRLRPLLPTDFQPGTVIRYYNIVHSVVQNPAPQDISHEPALQSSRVWSRAFSAQGKNIINSPYGILHLKERYAVVVWRFERHYIILPIYTYAGTGLNRPFNRPRLREYLPIRQRDSPDFRPQNENPVLMVDQWDINMYNLHHSSVVHYTFPLSMEYGQTAAVAGWLENDSTITLQNYYMAFTERPFFKTQAELDAGANPIQEVTADYATQTTPNNRVPATPKAAPKLSLSATTPFTTPKRTPVMTPLGRNRTPQIPPNILQQHSLNAALQATPNTGSTASPRTTPQSRLTYAQMTQRPATRCRGLRVRKAPAWYK